MGLTKIDDRGLKTPIDLLDNEKIRLGTGNDLELYHDGNNGNSHIKESGSGSLVLNADDLYLQNAAGTENLAVFKEDGAVELYHDNSKTAWTHGSGFNIKGGNTSDQTELIITGNEGRNAEILLAADDGDDNADYWKIISSSDNSFYLQNYTGGSYATNIKATGNAGVEVYFNNSKKFETTSDGVLMNGHTDYQDNQKARFGASDDLQIYHENTGNTYIQNATGNLRIDADALRLRSYTTGEDYLKADANGAVELYYDNTKKFETTAAGCKISTGVLDFFDNVEARFGSSGDFKIYHDGSHTKLKNATGHIIINSDSLDINNAADNETLAKFDHDGAVELYHNGTKKLSTTANGICFNSDTAAANALDDCEKGTWNPVLKFSNQTTSYTVSVAQGSYQKIGNLVYCKFVYELNGGSAGVSGTPEFHGLPFTVSNDLAGTGQEGFGQLTYWQSVNSASNYIFWVQDGGTVFNIIKVDGSGSGQTGNASSGDFNSSTAVRGSLVYMASS